MKINIANNEVIHFVGIGGIGMSGLAQIMKNMGFVIQGSDISKNKNIDRLKKIGIKIYNNHRIKNLKKVTMVIISSAIKKNNVELIAAKSKNLQIFKRAEMLANVISGSPGLLGIFFLLPPKSFTILFILTVFPLPTLRIPQLKLFFLFTLIIASTTSDT